MDKATTRFLYDLTGINNIYMEQIYSFSHVDRAPVERTISVAYFGLIDIARYCKDFLNNNQIQWFNLKDAPKLIFNHDIIEKSNV